MTVSQHEPMNENKIENKNESFEFWLSRHQIKQFWKGFYVVVLVFSLLFDSDSGFADIRQPRHQNGETDDQKSFTRVDASTPCPFRCVVISWRSLATTEPPTVESWPLVVTLSEPQTNESLKLKCPRMSRECFGGTRVTYQALIDC